MADLAVLKSYLISLGFRADQGQYNQADALLKMFESQVTRVTSGSATQFVKMGTAIVGVYTAIGSATIGLLDKISQSDLGYQLYAVRMMMSTDAAKKLKIATDALGHSLDDVFINPELTRQFQDLVDLQNKLQGSQGGDFETTMRQVRAMRFELTKMHVTATWLMQRLAGDIAKGLGITDLHGGLKDVGKWFAENIPTISRNIADILVPVTKQAYMLWEGIGLVLKAVAVDFMNLFAILSGDKSLEGTNVTLEKIGRTLQWIVYSIEPTIRAFVALIRAVAAIAEAFALWASGDFAGVDEREKQLWSDLKKDIAGILDAANVKNRPDIANSGARLTKGAEQALTGQTADQARGAAKVVSERTGIPADVIFGQWAHETGGFTNRGARDLNNLAGIKNPGGFGYRTFSSINEFADYYAKLMTGKYQGALNARTPEEFALALKRGGYYEDSYANYAAGIRKNMGGIGQTVMAGDTNIGSIIIQVPKDANPEDYKRAVIDAVNERAGKSVQRTLAEFDGPFQ